MLNSNKCSNVFKFNILTLIRTTLFVVLVTVLIPSPTSAILAELKPEPEPDSESVLRAGLYQIESVQTGSFLTAIPIGESSGVMKVKTLLGGEVLNQKWLVIPVGKTFLVINKLFQFNTLSTMAIGNSKRLSRVWQINRLGKDEDGPWLMIDVHLEKCLASGLRNGSEIQFMKCSKGESDQQWRFKLVRKLEAA